MITVSEDIQLGHRSCGEEAQKDATLSSGSFNIISSLEKRTLWEDVIAAFQYLKGAYKKAGEGLFTDRKSVV